MILPDPYYHDESAGITIFLGDARAILPCLPPASIDLVLTDPPYGLNDLLDGGRGLKSGVGEWQGQFREGLSWDFTVDDATILQLLNIAHHAIIWGGNYYPLPPRRGWLIWDKMQEHSSGHAELAWTTLEIPTRTFRMSRAQAYGRGKDHPTEKPIDLFRWCLSFVPDARIILDPFMGSGTTLRAAKDLGRKAIGIEIEEKYVERAVTRLQQSVLPLEVA